MLTVHQLSKSFNLQTLFTDVTFSINPGDRMGLIGPNGCGKTTMLRLINGSEPATSGTVSHPTGLRIGYLAQGFEPDPQLTYDSIIKQAVGSIDVLEADLLFLAQSLAAKPNDIALQQQYDDVLARLTHSDESRAAQIIEALGLDLVDPTLPAALLSGGQKTRLGLALTLLDDPQLLLLDEPTNHLDIGMLEWLETWLAGFSGGVLLVSHDRSFLDHVCNKILFLDPQTQQAREYAGNYSDYLAQWESEREKQMAAYLDQVAEIKRVEQDIRNVRAIASASEYASISPKKGGARMKEKGFKDYVRSSAKKKAKKAKAREAKLERYLDSDERVEKPGRSWQMRFDLDTAVTLGRSVMHIKNLVVGYKPEAPLCHIEDFYVQSGQRIVLTGENGIGKTTLLRTIAAKIPPLAGEIYLGASVQLGYMSQEQELLDPALSPVETLRLHSAGTETEIRTFLHQFLFTGDEPLKANRHLSYGQRARLELALLVVQGCNFLFLDEPINHLDIPSREMFEQTLLNFEGTTLSVVHDRTFIERFATEVWWLEDGTIRREMR